MPLADLVAEQLAADVLSLEETQAILIDLLFDLTMRAAVWESLMTAQFQKTAALQKSADALREEIRRYTASRVGQS